MKIAFSGLQGSGKTYLANQYRFNNGGFITKLATPVYIIAEKIQEITNQPKEKNRRLLQLIGTEIGRSIIDKDIWIKLLLEEIERVENICSPDICNVYVDDVRFKNEVQGLRKNGFKIVRVIRTKKYTKRRFVFHKSEIQLLGWELVDRIRKRLGMKLKYFDEIIYN